MRSRYKKQEIASHNLVRVCTVSHYTVLDATTAFLYVVLELWSYCAMILSTYSLGIRGICSVHGNSLFITKLKRSYNTPA